MKQWKCRVILRDFPWNSAWSLGWCPTMNHAYCIKTLIFASFCFCVRLIFRIVHEGVGVLFQWPPVKPNQPPSIPNRYPLWMVLKGPLTIFLTMDGFIFHHFPRGSQGLGAPIPAKPWDDSSRWRIVRHWHCQQSTFSVPSPHVCASRTTLKHRPKRKRRHWWKS